MILVFIVLILIILINAIVLILILSDIKLEFKKLHITNEKGKFKTEIILDIAIYAFDQFKIFKLTINNEKITNSLKSIKLNVLKFKDNNEISKGIIELLKHNDYKIEHLKLTGYFCTFDNVLSGVIYGLINAIIPIIIAQKMENRGYINDIKLLNINKNIINIDITCIISVKIVNIMNILYFLKKKGGNDNNGKSSNRRAYAYSNE